MSSKYEYIDPSTCFDKTEYLVEGDNFTLWSLYCKEDIDSYKCSHNWKDINGCYDFEVGRIDDRPICVSVKWFIINDVYVCIYDGISQLVDWSMIEDFMKTKFPNVALENKCDFANIMRMFNYVCSKNVDKNDTKRMRK